MLTPMLPPEVWWKVIAFIIRLPGTESVDLEDPFSPPYTTEESPEFNPGLSDDQSTLRLVCKQWSTFATRICVEYLFIRSTKQLRTIVEKFESIPENNLGEWTKRIDFRMSSQFHNVDLICRLFRCTPNLMIYVNRNGNDIIVDKRTRTPREVIKALVANCGRNLRRVEWANAEELIEWNDLLYLCTAAPNLQTLRIRTLDSRPSVIPWNKPPLLLPKLKTLSLGTPGDWDPFLDLLSRTPSQVDSLERLDVDVFPRNLTFFRVHGHKLRFFRTSTVTVPSELPNALAFCSNIHSLILLHSIEPLVLPRLHPALRRICIAHVKEDFDIRVPLPLFTAAVLRPLDCLMKEILLSKFPKLVELRIKNVGAYISLADDPEWLHGWWRTWNYRGVNFCDKMGWPFDRLAAEQDELLDSIRE